QLHRRRLQQTRRRVRSPLNRAMLFAGAACVKLQVDCLGLGVKIELDHGPINAPSCPLWVKSRHFAVQSRCPLYPRKRTRLSRVVMSALFQKRTYHADHENEKERPPCDGLPYIDDEPIINYG